MSDEKRKYRSAAWFAKTDKDGFVHRSWMRNQGLPDHVFDGRPVIGICNTWSELTPCNAHFRQIAEYVKRGVWEAGGLPVEFPVMSMGETNMRPTAMLFRNLVSMDVEESIRANPIDGVVLELDVDAWRIHLDVPQEELDRRRTKWRAPVDSIKGGYQQLYVERVMQANTGADLDFLTGCRGDDIPRESH